MSAIDYEAIHTAIKDIIKANGFEYAYADEWFNLERGDEIPEGLKGKAFNVQFGSQSPRTDIDARSVETQVVVEFLLDARKDNYLRFLGSCQNAVEALETINISGIDVQIKPGRGDKIELFNRTFVVGDKVVLTFDSIVLLTRTFKE